MIEDSTTCLRDQLLVRLHRRLGARVSEILGIEEKHVDFSKRQIKIEHEKERKALYCPYCPQGKDRTRLSRKALFCPRCAKPVKDVITKVTDELSLRRIPVDEDTLNLIRQYIKEGGITEVDGKRLLFNISRQRAWQIMVATSERAGFFKLVNPKNDKEHHISSHKFRDAFAINAMRLKPSYDDARLLQELLGHATIDTTMRYRKIKGEELQSFYDDLIKSGDK